MEEISKDDPKRFQFAYEESYGYIVRDICRDKNSIESLAIISEMINHYYLKGLRLDQVMDKIYDEFGYTFNKNIELYFNSSEASAELEASYKAFDERHFELPETDDAEGEKWAEFAQMMADRTVLNVKIAEAVKGGVVAFVNEVRAFIPASQLSTEYVEKLEDWQGKHVDAVIITVDPEKKRLVLSGREVEKEKKAAQRKERLAQFKAGDVVEGTVDNIKDYGAFVKLADGIDGLLHISQISTQRIKHPGAVLKEGQTVKVKILSIADGKISLSMKALIEQETEEEEHETFDYKETAAATTGLGDLLKGLKL